MNGTGIIQDTEGVWRACPYCGGRLWKVFGAGGNIDINMADIPKYCPKCGKKVTEEDEPIELTCDTFGDWLQGIKETNGYTYEFMSHKTGLSKFALQSYVTRHSPPSLDSIVRIVKAFGRRLEIR